MKYLSDRMTALRAKTRLTEVTKDGDSDAEGGPRNPEARQGPKGFEPPRVEIPIRDCSPDSSEISHFQTRGRFLARQDCWDELSRIIAEADSSRSVTSGGTPVARLYAQGAHADALESALAAVDRCDPTSARRILYSLRDAIEGVETDPYLAIIAAQAHLAVATAWDGRTGAPAPTPLRLDARAQNLESAHRLVSRFDPLEHNSPALAALRCALLDLQPRPSCRVADDYEDLIDLDPSCPDHLRALGRDMMPSRFGTWALLDHEARRTAGRTSDIWGAGGYSWVWMDVLAADPEGFEHVDGELFTEGLHDILTRRPDQHMANLLAAYCGLTLSGAAKRGSIRARITGCFGWIVQDHLREIYPDLWALARPVPGMIDLGVSLRRGQVRATSALAEHFSHHLAQGRQVIIHANGVELRPAGCSSSQVDPCSALAFPRQSKAAVERPLRIQVPDDLHDMTVASGKVTAAEAPTAAMDAPIVARRTILRGPASPRPQKGRAAPL